MLQKIRILSCLCAGLFAATQGMAAESVAQRATLTVIATEIRAAGLAWGKKPGKADFLELLPNRGAFVAPSDFIKSCWPYNAGLKTGEEPPGPKAMFVLDIPDLKNTTAEQFLKQFARYLGALGEATGDYPYVQASEMPASECDELGDKLFGLYKGGDKAGWRKAAVLARSGIVALVNRAIPLLEKQLREKVAQLSPVPANADQRTKDCTLVLVTLVANLAKHSNLHDKFEFMHGTVEPYAQHLVDPKAPGKK